VAKKSAPSDEGIAYEEETPTHKRFGAPMDALIGKLESRNEDDSLTFEEAEEFLAAATLLVDCTGAQEIIKENFGAGISVLHHLAAENPEILQDVRTALTSITLAVVCATNEIACQAIAHESATQGHIYRKNAEIASMADQARAVASEVWNADADHEYRIDEVARLVSDELERRGLQPPQKDTLKKWIRPVAPPYASKGGRPKKT
jgi:hypothetical protein